ncbi:MAG: hypothetical protein SFT92_01105 [Rickettsiales bacterium]|nr:hypothetical protein [Rickettsiales bacterium]
MVHYILPALAVGDCAVVNVTSCALADASFATQDIAEAIQYSSKALYTLPTEQLTQLISLNNPKTPYHSIKSDDISSTLKNRFIKLNAINGR